MANQQPQQPQRPSLTLLHSHVVSPTFSTPVGYSRKAPLFLETIIPTRNQLRSEPPRWMATKTRETIDFTWPYQTSSTAAPARAIRVVAKTETLIVALERINRYHAHTEWRICHATKNLSELDDDSQWRETHPDTTKGPFEIIYILRVTTFESAENPRSGEAPKTLRENAQYRIPMSTWQNLLTELGVDMTQPSLTADTADTADTDVTQFLLYDLENNRIITDARAFINLYLEARKSKNRTYFHMNRLLFAKTFRVDITAPKIVDAVSDDPSERSCQICLEEYGSENACGQPLTCRFCPCTGHFEEKCIKVWLLESWNCPVCRSETEKWEFEGGPVNA